MVEQLILSHEKFKEKLRSLLARSIEITQKGVRKRIVGLKYQV